MEITERHFLKSLSPKEKLAYLKKLAGIDNKIMDVLYEELKRGNIILSVVSGWPEANSISICLQKKFSKNYSTVDLEYSHINDVHYGAYQYTTRYEPFHSIICSF